MKKRLAAILVALGLLIGAAVVSAVPSQASDSVASKATAMPAEANGFKFWTGSICIDGSGINSDRYLVAYLAQQWNLRVNNPDYLSLQYEDDCAAAGYPPSRRMVVGAYNNPNDPYCTTPVNQQYADYGGFHRWTNGPGVYLNIGQLNCVSSQNRRSHLVSMAIGNVLGLKLLNSAGYNSRVMNQTAYSYDNIYLPDQNSALVLSGIYGGLWCNPFPC